MSKPEKARFALVDPWGRKVVLIYHERPLDIQRNDLILEVRGPLEGLLGKVQISLGDLKDAIEFIEWKMERDE